MLPLSTGLDLNLDLVMTGEGSLCRSQGARRDPVQELIIPQKAFFVEAIFRYQYLSNAGIINNILNRFPSEGFYKLSRMIPALFR